MAIPNLMCRCLDSSDSPIELERRDQAAVLLLLLDEHPARLTLDELVLVMHADAERGDPGGAAHHAVRDLIGAGLVNREGRFLSPTRAALYFAALDAS